MPENPSIYLDHAATTPVALEVFEAMRPFFCDTFGNPATLYQGGRRAAAAVENAREQIAALIGAHPEEIVFTSGGTESNNWAIKCALGVRGNHHFITSAVEHHAVLETCHHLAKKEIGELLVLPVNALGAVDPEDLREAIQPDTALISIMHANNEVGTIEPITDLAAIAREKGVVFHTDAVQSIGKIPVNVSELGVDLLSMSAHKFEGPKGVGALYVRRGVRLESFIHGGSQEQHRRAGTVNVPAVVGMGAAAELARLNLEQSRVHEASLIDALWDGLSSRISNLQRNGDLTHHLPNILNISFAGVEGEAVLLQLDAMGIEAAAGSACASGSAEISHVLKAMGLIPELARAAIRFSVGRQTTHRDIDRVIEVLPNIIQRLRDMSPLK